MPKNTKKNRPGRGATSKTTTNEENISADEVGSVSSNVSDANSNCDEADASVPTANEIILSSDNLEEKLDSALEGIRNKDLKTRENALKTLQVLFSQKYIPDLVTARRESLIEQLVNCLKKGSESDGKLAGLVTSLTFIQFGEPNDELYRVFRDAILPILRDSTNSSSLRASYAQTIGTVCFIACEDISSTVDLMKLLESIFSKSYLLEDGSMPVVARDQQELHTAALSSWCLLASTMPDNQAHELVRLYAPEKIPGLIESTDPELRNQAGEAIAVLYEIARDINSIFADPPQTLLMELDKKANESAKYKGKKEKRLQRATFREIYNSFVEGTSPEFTIKFGREVLEIMSWTGRLYYNGFSGLLGTGMNVHLKENGFLRSVFNLDDAVVEENSQAKGNRFERQLANKAAFKLRTQALKKTRANKMIRSQHDD